MDEKIWRKNQRKKFDKKLDRKIWQKIWRKNLTKKFDDKIWQKMWRENLVKKCDEISRKNGVWQKKSGANENLGNHVKYKVLTWQASYDTKIGLIRYKYQH